MKTGAFITQDEMRRASLHLTSGWSAFYRDGGQFIHARTFGLKRNCSEAVLSPALRLRQLANGLNAAASDATMLAGTCALYETVSADPTIAPVLFRRGCFTKSIAVDDCVVICAYDTSKVLGRTKAGTARLYSTPDALRYEVSLPETSYANDLAVSIERGDISSAVAGCVPVVRHYEVIRDKRVMVIDEARLTSISVVAFGASNDTAISKDKQQAAATFGALNGTRTIQ